ncbi:cation transporter [Klebsiella pneumoniae]|nr:cation transporter [Klebsiella pneumoniae]
MVTLWGNYEGISQDDAINALKTGNHVDFSFIQQGNISLLKSINVTQS